MDEVQELSWGAVLQNRLPTLAILAEKDRIVDNNKFQQFMGPMFTGKSRNKLIMVDSGHAIQFERPEEVAKELISFLRSQK
jgi:pimeloyl-ACP methyl ester carboxylesterase